MRNYITYVLFTFLLYFTSLSVYAQKNLNKGLKKFNKGEYEQAIQIFKKQIKSNSHLGETNFWIAEAYRLSNRLKLAKPYYEEAIKHEFEKDELNYNYVKALMIHEEYNLAQSKLEEYLVSNEDLDLEEDTEENVSIRKELKRVKVLLSNIYMLENLQEQKPIFRIKHMPFINTRHAEYAPFYYKGELFFTSNRDSDNIYKGTGTGFTDIYKVKSKGAIIDTTKVEKMTSRINHSDANEGSLAISPNGKIRVFARGNNGKKKGTQDVNLYISYLRKGKWTEPEIMEISYLEGWDSNPCFSKSGKKLYFSSNRPGGYGGADLYAAKRDDRGRWVQVKNMGSSINSMGNDMFPFVSRYGKFYFASDGHVGFGGLDIFAAERENGTTVVRNLGKPVNSSSDDFGIFIFSKGKGFFCSNRPGGKGDDDIYTFVNTDPEKKIINYYLKGKVLAQNNNKKILSGATLSLYDKEGKFIGHVTSDKKGRYKFRVYEEEEYEIIVEKEGYLSARVNFATIGKSVKKETLTKQVNTKVFDLDIYLNTLELNKAIVLENIYYDFDRSNIREDAALELDKLVNILNDNPKIKIELGSHTDNKGEASYNEDLSQRRAESAVRYIIEKGIEETRLEAKGYGESTPIAKNINEDGSDNVEGRQKNRRTEFKITEIIGKERKSANQSLEEQLFGD